MKFVLALAAALCLGCTSPRIGAGASGDMYCYVQTKNDLYLLDARGGVDAVYQRLGTTVYVAAVGNGALKLTNKDLDSGEVKTYLNVSVEGQAGWRIELVAGLPVVANITYDEAVKVTGVPGRVE